VESNRPNINYDSPEWAKVEEWLAGDLLDKYHRLAGLSCTEVETQRLRGIIMYIRGLLDFRNDEGTDKPLL
jgi:hypothetical protein